MWNRLSQHLELGRRFRTILFWQHRKYFGLYRLPLQTFCPLGLLRRPEVGRRRRLELGRGRRRLFEFLRRFCRLDL